MQAESQKLTYLKELGKMGNINMWLKLIKTSKICHSLNGNVFKFKDMIPGVNAHRRSTTVPHVKLAE